MFELTFCKSSICLGKLCARVFTRPGKKQLMFMLTAIALSMTTSGFCQNITFSGKKIPLSQAFAVIKKQTSYAIVFNPKDMSNASPVTIDAKNMPLETFLKTILDKQPLAYYIENTTIVIYKAVTITITQPAAFTVSGVVRDSYLRPLDAVSVVVLHTRLGTTTNAGGEFTLKNIEATDTLGISIIGYKPEQVPISGQSALTIVLKEASNKLDEVVKTAYGRTSQRYTTGNITKITAAEIERQPVMNPLLALQGRVPGMVVTPTTGFASSPVSVQIRGLNSLNTLAPSDPLYIIDGVPLTVLSPDDFYNYGLPPNFISAGLIQAGGFGTTNGQSPLFSINPEDIESIEVLKDADATAVYGSRGSNGVILITTKKGAPGATRFNFHIDPPFLSIGKNTRHIQMLSTPQYLQMRREAFKNDGLTPNLQNARDLLLWDTTRYTDWQKATNGGTARNLNISAEISGGSDLTGFRVNGNYTRLTNTTNISGAIQRITLGANLNNTSRDHKFSFNLSSNFSYSYVNVVLPVINPWLAPNAPPIFDKSGNPNWAEWDGNGSLPDIYPFSSNLKPANPQSTTTLTSGMQLKYKPVKGLVLSAVLGYNLAYNTTKTFGTIASQSPYINNRTGSLAVGTTQNTGWTINPQINYNILAGKSDLMLGVVATEQFVATNVSNTNGFNYISDALLGSISNAPIQISVNSPSQGKNASFVGMINYIYDKKYILNLNGSRQGSSKFGPDNKYGNFGSIGAGWIASEERWIMNLLPPVITFLKFRASYGLTGSDNIGNYQYLALWQYSSYANGGYDGQPIVIPSVRPNQHYKWENDTKLEEAINIGLFDDQRINLQIVHYRDRISDQLSSYPTPSFLNSTQVSGIVTNVPLLLQNSGWEGSIDAKLIRGKEFNLSAFFNISHNKNVLLAFPGLSQTPYAGQYNIGRSLNSIYLFHFLGIDPLTGLPAFKDYNGNGYIDNDQSFSPTKGSDDRAIVYDLSPKFTGGFGLTANYKRLNISTVFSYVKKIGQNIYASLPAQPGVFNVNEPEAIFDHSWHKPGDKALYPAFSTLSGTTMNYYAASDAAYTDASFIRLTNLSVSYTLPDAWGKKIGMKNLGVSVNAQNVFVITGYKGGDPETQSVFPLPRLFIFRLNYGF